MPEVCSDCGQSFAEPSDLVVHMRTAHGGGDAAASMDTNPFSHTPGFACALCGASFATPEELAKHDLRPHPNASRAGGPAPAVG